MKQVIFIWLFLLGQFAFTQNANRSFKSINQTNLGFDIWVNDGKYEIIFYNNQVVETTFIPNGEKLIKSSHAIVAKPNKVEIKAVQSTTKSEFFTGGLSVHVQHNPFQIAYKYKNRLITSEKKGYVKSKHIPLESVKGNIIAEETEKISFNLSKNEVLYGGGARALGMNRRGHRLPLFNRAHYGYQTYSELMNFTLPIVVSSNMYMLHFDNAPVGYLDLDSQKDNSLTYETVSGRKTYQVIVGDSWLDLLKNYTELTGRQPLPPRWAFGNFASRFGYRSDKETETTIRKFKEEKIPVDAVILDLYWFGKTVKGTMGNLAVDRDSFPDMEGMIARLKKQNVKTILITEPFVLSTSKRWKEAIKENVLAKNQQGKPYAYDFYFGNTGIIDIYSKKGEQWFWDRYKEIINMGVQGLWGDLGEPEVHPHDIIHATGTGAEVHNIYGHDWARLVFEGYQRDYPNQRPFILMRAGYSGSQRYGLIPWSGDVSRSWGGLQSQPEISLQMGMQGIGYMHSDLGGFAGANLDDELYTRWLQYGVFQPIFRPHAQEDVASEPVFRSSKAKQLAKESIELRYKLLPYNYNLAFTNSQSGAPFMFPLFFEEPSNKQLDSISSTYLWGPDILVTPILRKGQKEAEVYFPKTSNWFDFYSGQMIKGGQTKMFKTMENSIPTFVRGGTFLLTSKSVQSTEDYNPSDVVLHYYSDESLPESERVYYNDDGKTPDAFKKGLYEFLEFEAEYEKNSLEIDFESELGKSWKHSTKKVELLVHNIQWDVKWIKVNRKKVAIQKKGNTIKIPVLWNTEKEVKIRIKRK